MTFARVGSQGERYIAGWGQSDVFILTSTIVGGFLLRVFWMMSATPVISLEGAEYVRMAQHLAEGQGLVGNIAGPETMYPPLLPLLTACLMRFGLSGEMAAHLLALVFGTALIPALFFLARKVYDTKVALICAALEACNPLLVDLSGSIYSESIYITLFVIGINYGLRAIPREGRWQDAALCGVCFGFAYLSRPEAFAYPLFFSIALLTARIARRQRIKAALAALAVLVAFGVTAAPYVAYLYEHTGAARLEGKWNINYTIAQNLRAGLKPVAASYAIDEDLSLKGPLLAPNHFANFTPYRQTLADEIETLFFMANDQKMVAYQNLASISIGAPVLWLLIVIGWFAAPWDNRRLVDELILMVVGASVVFLMLTGPGAKFRFIFPLVPILVLWGAKGLDELARWCARLELWRAFSQPFGRRAAVFVPLVVAVSTILLSAWGTRSEDEFAMESASYAQATRNAGLWLRDFQPEAKQVAARFSMLPYYADATLIQMPYADAALTLRYVAAQHPDFIVLESIYSQSMPVIGRWIADGIPDARARKIYDRVSDKGDRVVIYSWDGA